MKSNQIGDDQTDLVLLAVRLFIGFELLWHGLPKLLDAPAASAKFASIGFPGMLAPLVGALEVGAAGLILVGYLTPFAVLVAFSIVAVGMAVVQLPQGGVHAALERDVLILLTTLVLLSFGPGRYSIGSKLPQPAFLSRKTEG